MSEWDGHEEDGQEEDRLSFAAYFGATTGLLIGLIGAMLLAFGADRFWPQSQAADVIWEVGSAVFALLGLFFFGHLFHRHLRGQIVLPACLFLAVLAIGLFLAVGPVGFPWRDHG